MTLLTLQWTERQPAVQIQRHADLDCRKVGHKLCPLKQKAAFTLTWHCKSGPHHLSALSLFIVILNGTCTLYYSPFAAINYSTTARIFEWQVGHG